MQPFFTLTRRELAGFFLSFSGYVVIASVLLLVGLSFWDLLEIMRGENANAPVTELFFRSYFFWTILILSAPVITMRLFAQEKFTGTFETLMTTPVSDLQVVLAKFIAALIYYLLMWLPLLAYLLILRRYTDAGMPADWGTIGSTFLGIFLMGCLFMSLGSFASALTRSQITAAIITLLIGMAFVVLGFLAKATPSGPVWLPDVLNYISIFDHLEDFSRGVIDTRPIAFYGTSTFFFLFLTYRVVESRRWK